MSSTCALDDGDLPTTTPRERAIAYLTLLADYGADADAVESYLGGGCIDSGDFLPHDPAWRLVDDATNAVALAIGLGYVNLEAAALLRDGWNPGDPVEVLR